MAYMLFLLSLLKIDPFKEELFFEFIDQGIDLK
ncbi:MAG: hypothetical protein ACJAXX_001624, partial [Roseivirga sp.]